MIFKGVRIFLWQPPGKPLVAFEQGSETGEYAVGFWD